MATYAAEDVIDMAVERASLNREDLIPTSQSLDYITIFERKAFIDAARLNPDYFGKSETTSRGSSSDVWDLENDPGDVASVKRVEVSSVTGSMSSVSAGDEVSIIDLDTPDVSLSPRATLRDFRIEEYNGELSDDASNYVSALKVYYSKFPQKITDKTQTLEIPDMWIDLVKLPLARVYAIRDQRLDESQILDKDIQRARQMFAAHLQTFDQAANKSLQQRGNPVPAMSGGESSG